MRENIPAVLEEFETRVADMGKALHVEKREAELAAFTERMNAPTFWDDPDKANKMLAEMKAVKVVLEPWKAAAAKVEDAVLLWDMAGEAGDQESKEEVDQQLDQIEADLDKLEITSLLSGKHDAKAAYMTIQSGAGGTEADDWAEMLMRMYMYYFEKQGFGATEVSMTHGTEAGVKEVTLHVTGPFAYGYLSAERGTHRLARVSPYNAEGKRQTSFATVDIVPEFEDDGKLEIDENELEITAFARSSGPGGQNVNKVASAVRIVHQPTQIMVVCSVHRKQEQNRKQALGILRAKLELLEEEKRQAEMDDATGGKVDRGWGTQIRSYVFYDNRVKDHRTGFEKGNPQSVMDGDIQGFIEAELRRRV